LRNSSGSFATFGRDSYCGDLEYVLLIFIEHRSYFSAWIAMNAAQVRIEEATNTRNGFTGDFVDLAIASLPDVSGEATTEC
jgi:hypothetical protein